MGQLGVPEVLLLVLVIPVFLLFAYLFGRVCRKAGFSPWLGVAGVIPVANFLLLLFLAFTEWPNMRRDAPLD